jgi:acetyltransferase-like isoleucine patch superfamily enzyme/coenzyme F420-reducing hydrogenase beta subunit
MERDHEGFWYPKVDTDHCDNCRRCERVCPLLEAESLVLNRTETPMVLAAWNKNQVVRMDSTSGGVFSSLASQMLDRKGYVAGAVFAQDHTVTHVVTDEGQMIEKIRSSKYLQSYIGEAFGRIRQLLENGKQVLVCGTPCQIAGLYHVLGNDPENLTTCDFICRGVNSPKVFLLYMEMLERKYGARAVRIKFKNKTYGWHRFSTRIDFANGKTYIQDRYHDLFMQGYLKYNTYVRPSCYRCQFKGLPRQADITLADFWGINENRPELDNDTGTSAVLLNSEKGRTLFVNTSHSMFSRECTLQAVAAGNPCLNQSLERKPGRDEFFADIDAMSFDELSRKHFPVPGRMSEIAQRFRTKAKSTARGLLRNEWRHMGLSPTAWLQCLYINVLRKNTQAEVRHFKVIIPTRGCRVVIDSSARIIFNGRFILGWKRIRHSARETRLSVGRNSVLTVNGDCNAFCGTDIWVMDNGELTLNECFCNEGVQITCAKRIVIGKGSVIARDVLIRDNDAHQILGTGHEMVKEIAIGEHVWIGTRAMILKGVTLGDGAIIAAGAIVTRDVPAHSMVAGIPARVIRTDIEWR